MSVIIKSVAVQDVAIELENLAEVTVNLTGKKIWAKQFVVHFYMATGTNLTMAKGEDGVWAGVVGDVVDEILSAAREIQATAVQPVGC